jgi:HK97 family phage portal protein
MSRKYSISKLFNRRFSRDGQKQISNTPGKFLMPVFNNLTANWTMVDFSAYVSDGFEQNTLIYSAIMYKVRAISQVNVRGFTLNENGIPKRVNGKHALSDLVERPNAYQTWASLQGQVMAYLNISGNAYYLLLRNSSTKIPEAIITLRPDRVRIVPNPENSSSILGFAYVPEGVSTVDAIPILAEDIIHIKFPNPGDELNGLGYGLSPIAPLAKSGDVDNQITTFLKAFFERGAIPAGLLKFDIPLTEDQVGMIKTRWAEKYGGVENWTDVGVLDNSGSYEKMGFTFEQMGFNSIDDRNESRILGPFGVPPILIGAKIGLDRATYANYKEARAAFWEDTMSYELQLQADEFALRLGSVDGVFLGFDTTGVSAFKKEIGELIDSAHKLWSMGVPANDAFETVGISVSEFPSSDQSYIPLYVGTPEQLALQNDGKAIQHTLPKPKTVRNAPSKPNTKYKDSLIKSINNIAETDEDVYKQGATEQFASDSRAVLAIIDDVPKAALKERKNINWESAMPAIDEYLAGESAEAWRNKFVPLISGTVENTGGFWSAELGTVFNLRNTLAEEWFESYMLEFSEPISATTSASLKEILAQAQAEGWSNGITQQRISDVFQQWMDGGVPPEDFAWMSERSVPYRTEMIARTETIKAANAGSQQLFTEWEVKKKEWSAVGDGRTRLDHIAADGQVRKINEPFEVGGDKMMYPLDGSLGADASQIVNCRCALLPVV